MNTTTLSILRSNMIIHNVVGSKLGNMMMKYMAAVKLADRIGFVKLSNYSMVEWNIQNAAVPEKPDDCILTIAPPDREMHINFERAAYLGSTRLVDRLHIYGHVQRIENFPTLQRSRELFMDNDGIGEEFPGHVICPVRGAEILDAIHPGYTLLPVTFYKEVITHLGMPPVFIGQLGSDIYSLAIREAFPDAVYRPNAGALADFQTIRNATAVVVSVSTFSWMAAWLSRAETIVLPCFGIFNRHRFGDHDLLPLGDNRYRFYAFPVQDAVPLADFAAAHRALSWQLVAPSALIRAD